MLPFEFLRCTSRLKQAVPARIVTDRLYRLAEIYGLLDLSQKGYCRLHSTQRQVQSLHWAVQEAAERSLWRV